MQAYKERLRSPPIQEGFGDVKDAKERLAEQLMVVAKNNKTDPWTMDNLEEVLKNLKNNKSRDPN